MTPYFTDIDGLLADPLVRMMMSADRVDATALRRDLSQVAARVSNRPPKLDLGGARVRFAPDARSHGPRPLPPNMGCEARVCC
jgi:hypothetical protein